MTTSSNRPDRDTKTVYAGFPLVGMVRGWQFADSGVEEGVMKGWIGVAFVAAALAFDVPQAVAETGAAPRAKAAVTSGATDLTARRIFRDRPAYAGYPYSPTYFARPYYYRPYPYGVPVPFFLGFAYLPSY
jgi:hypothetical protein